MSDEIGSFLLGTIPLDVLLLVALHRTCARGPVAGDPAARRRLAALFAAAIAVQGAHFAEEWAADFHLRFPALLGLHPWSLELWAGFNLFWIAVWCLALPGLLRGWRPALLPVWFLALACLVNAAAHPLLALAAGGYFPGLWSSPICGLVGVPFYLLLARLTRPRDAPAATS